MDTARTEHYQEVIALTPIMPSHELIHWTGHGSCLNPHLERAIGNKESLAKEELMAEIGSAFLCADRSITPAVREDHAAYIKIWLALLKCDKRLIFASAAHANRAVR